MPRYPKEIVYGEKFFDGKYEYRNIMLPKELFAKIQHLKGKLVPEHEWRKLPLKVTPGWEHYETYKPEPYILMLRRPVAKK